MFFSLEKEKSLSFLVPQFVNFVTSLFQSIIINQV